MTSCLNCGHRFNGNFCPHCGQSAHVERLTAVSLLEEFLHAFTHFEKGFFHTSWSFLYRPGTSAINYLNGKRKKFQQPVGYFLIWTGLYVLLHNFIINHYHYRFSAEVLARFGLQEQANILLRTHLTPFLILIYLFSAFLIYLVLARPRFNFIEIITSCLYGGSTYFMLLFISDVVLGIIFRQNIISPGIFLWQTILSFIYNFWYCYDFFKKAKIRFLWLRLITVSILITLGGWLIMEYVPLIWLHVSR